MPNSSSDVNDNIAQQIAKGTSRLLFDMGFDCLSEFTLPNGRRMDLLALNAKGQVLAVEIKSSLQDFQSDHKWHEYLEYCDYFYFAVTEGFPIEYLPEDEGLIIADNFSADVMRPATERKLVTARRKALTLKYALTAVRRLQKLHDEL